MAENGAALGMGVTAATIMFSGFTAFLPPLREVRRAGESDVTIYNDVRYGQVATAVMALGIGGIMAYLSRSVTPLYVALAATAIFAIIYELALKNRRG